MAISCINLDSLLGHTSRAVAASRAIVQEKVYLHFDNTGYYMGEKIWFKAYVVRADNGHPTDKSRVLYVELLDAKGDVIEQRKLKIDEKGQARGDLPLDNLLRTGFYEVRAYTRYMTNWGSHAAFSRVFPVFRNSKTTGQDSLKGETDNHRHRLPDLRGKDTLYRERLNVTFYPEGGRLVKGLKSRVAFQVYDNDGRHVKVSGEVKDKRDTTVCHVVSDSLGCGIFEIEPDGSPLRLCLEDGRGKERDFPLPAPRTDGCVLSLDMLQDDTVDFSVCGTEGIRHELLGYVLMNYGRVLTCDTFTIGSGFRKSFCRETLPEGVNQLTVFDGTGRVWAERLFFICPDAAPEERIHIEPQTPAPSPYDKVKLEVHTLPGTTFSFSAMDANALTNGKSGNVKTWLLLSSELKGYIARPEYYFEADDAEHRRAADLLMMTQGWRRYDWEQLSGYHPMALTQPAENRLYLFGRLKGTGRGTLPVGDLPVKADLYAGGNALDGEATTDSTGRYVFALPDVYGRWNLQIKVKAKKRRNRYIVGIDRNFSPPPRMLSPYELRTCLVSSRNLSFPLQASHAKTDTDTVPLPLTERLHELPTVEVEHRYWEGARAAWQSENQGRYWANLYYDCDREADRILDEGKELPGFEDWLLDKNPFFAGTPGRLSGEYSNESDLTYKGRHVVWILNNSFYEITPRLSGFDVKLDSSMIRHVEDFPIFLDEVKSVYISEAPSAFQSYISIPGARDMVTVFVYAPWASSRKMEKGVRRTYFQSYDVPSTFEMNDYSLMPPEEDFRRTLYWNPDVTTDKDGKAVIEFYNNSSCREIYVSAEGITPDGRCIFNE